MGPAGPAQPGPAPGRAPGDPAAHRLRHHPSRGLPRATRRVLRDPGRPAGQQGGRRSVRGGANRHRHRPADSAAEPARVRRGLRRQHRAHRDRGPGRAGVAALCHEPATAGDVRAAMPHPAAGSEADPIALEPVEDVVVTTPVDNVYDALLTGDDTISRAPLAAGTARAPQFETGRTDVGLMAEHGFSALVTVRRGDTTTSVLFDTGLSPDAMVTNADRLGLDLSGVHAVVLSHGHFDHAGGLAGLAGRRGTRSVPMIVHPLVWTRRRLTLPGGGADDWPTLSKRALTGEGFDVIERRQPSLLVDGSILITGEVDRTTDFEHGMPPAHQRWTGTTWEPDPLILDDQALVVNVRGKGLVIVTGCGHAGAVNIVRHAQRLTGVNPLHASLGGLHLGGAFFAPSIGPTVHALTELAPDLLVPGHCTGWRAQHALAAALPDSWVQSSSGTRYQLTAS